MNDIDMERKIADKNIRCYKLLTPLNGGYTIPIQLCPVNDNILSGKELFIAEGEETEFKIANVRIPKGGFIHTYATFLEALEWASLIQDGCIVYECFIEKGTEYGNITDRTYASKSIKFSKEICIDSKTLIGMLPEKLYTNKDGTKFSVKNTTEYVCRRYFVSYTVINNSECTKDICTVPAGGRL